MSEQAIKKGTYYWREWIHWRLIDALLPKSGFKML